MTDRKQMSGNLPAEFAERVSDRSCFAERLVCEEVEPAPAPIPDDMVSRLQVIEALDRMVSDRQKIVNPRSAWWLTDTAILGVLSAVRDIVIELEGS